VVRVAGEGEPPPPQMSPDGTGVRGDLHIVVRVAEDERFERQGSDLITALEVSFADAALGGSVSIETLDGVSETDLDAGTQHGELFRLDGKGVPDLRTGQRGDLVVVVHVVVPRRLSNKQRELITALRDAERPAPPPKDSARKNPVGKDATGKDSSGKGHAKGGFGKATKKEDSSAKSPGFWGKVKDSFGT
jgi:molecular chaperone DnaJ